MNTNLTFQLHPLLDVIEKDKLRMFVLMQEHYDAVNRDQFDIDLNKTATNKTFSKFQTQLAMTSAYYKGIYSENTIKKESFIANHLSKRPATETLQTQSNQHLTNDVFFY